MVGLQANLYVGIGVTWIAAFVALLMRVVARRMTKIKWWIDDYFCVTAFLFATGYCGILVEWTLHWSLGKKMPDSMDSATRENILYHSRLLSYFNSLCYASSLAASKASILSFYWRLFSISTIRIPILVMLVITGIWFLIRTFMLTFRCVPVQAIWDTSIKDAKCRIHSEQFFFGTIITHFLMDVIILILPIIEVVRLRLRFGQKLGVIALFTLGTIVCVASALVLVQLVNYPDNTTQMPYDYAMYCVLGAVEVNIAIVSACFPLLRPVFAYVLPAKFLSSLGSSQPISRPSNIRLTTIPRTKTGIDPDDSSSVHRLADPEPGDYDLSHGESSKGIHTVISSQYPSSEASSSCERDLAGIHVRNDTIVEVQEVVSHKGFRK